MFWFFVPFSHFENLLDVNISSTSINSQKDKIISKQEQNNCKKRLSDHESDRVNLRLDDTLGNEKNGKLKNNSTNQTLRKLSCSNNSIYNCSNNHTTFQYDGINRSATTNDVHFLIREGQDNDTKKEVDEENITAKTPFLSDARSRNCVQWIYQ